MVQIGTCAKQNTCYDCDGITENGKCAFAGYKSSDCTKYHCPDEGNCDHCTFIDSLIKQMREYYKEEQQKCSEG